MAKEKSLVEDAITQIKGLEDVLAENAKGILRSTMKEEISDLVKESLSEQEDEEVEMELDVDDLGIDDDESEELEFDMDDDNDELENELSLDIEALGLGMDDDDEETIDLTDIDDEDEILRVFSLMGPDDNIVVTQDDAGNINLKDDEKEYMIVGEGEEEIEIELEEDLEFDSEIELDEEEDEVFDEESIEDIVSRVFDESYGGIEEDEMESDEEEMDVEEEIMYEIEFDEEDEDEFTEIDLEETLEESKPKFTYGSNPNSKGFNTKMKKADPKKGTGKAKFEFKEGQGYDDKEDESLGMEDGKISKKDFKGTKKRKSKSRRDDAHFETREGHYSKEETKEASRTLGNGKYWGRKGLNKPKAAPRNIRVENTNTRELKVLREKNEEYRKALNVFRNKLNEVAIFNSNLAYSTRLFTEHSTSKTEKINILRRFDNVDTIKESKGLYRTIKNELSTDNGNSKPMNESIGKTIDKNLSTGSSQNLIESKTYENPQFLRMKDLMSKL
tara:strand:+ start:24615 stop:26123 length:1509 start_codon:yes stop_codon:yes gene_type:complete